MAPQNPRCNSEKHAGDEIPGRHVPTVKGV